MTRVIHMSGYEPEQRGSFVPFVLSALSAAKARDWQVEAVFPEGARHRFWLGDFELAGIPVTFKSGSRRELAQWLDDRLDEKEPVILHTHFTRYDISAALVGSRRPNARVYWHIHSILSRRPARVAGHVVKFAVVGRLVDRILSPAENVVESVVRRGGPRRKISVFPNTIDPGAFPGISAERRRQIRRELRISDHDEVLLHFGRDWSVKGGKIFLDALAILIEEGRPVLGLFNRAGDKACRYIEQQGLREHVRVIDLMPNPQALYGAADVMVAPSRGETMPYAVMESLCSGTAVVASDLPGHRYLANALDACAIAPRTPERFAEATREFLEMGPGRRTDLCATARGWICEWLDVKVAAERLMADYEESLAS